MLRSSSAQESPEPPLRPKPNRTPPRSPSLSPAARVARFRFLEPRECHRGIAPREMEDRPVLAVEWHGMKASSNEVAPVTNPSERRAQSDLRTTVRRRPDGLCDGRGRVAFRDPPNAPLSHDSVVHRSAYRGDSLRCGRCLRPSRVRKRDGQVPPLLGARRPIPKAIFSLRRGGVWGG